MTKKLDGMKKLTPKQRSYSDRHTLYLALSSLQTCPSLITKVGEQLADYFPCGGGGGGFVVTDQGEKVSRQSGVSGAQTRDFRHVLSKKRGLKSIDYTLFLSHYSTELTIHCILV